MAKICKDSGCSRNVFGGGYCMAHQWRRTDKKTKKLAKRAVKSNIKAYDFGFLSQPELFKHVYFIHKKPVICPVSGRDITDCMNGPIGHWVKHFAHILPKGKYTYWKLNPRNILILHPEVHDIFDQGTQDDRDKYPDWNWHWLDVTVEIAKKEYVEFVKANNL